MDKWIEGTLLPSLFEKWQGRNKQYDNIIVSEKQASCLKKALFVNRSLKVTSWDGFFQDRKCSLFYARGYWRLWFDVLTNKEHEQAENEQREKDAKREMSTVLRAIEKNDQSMIERLTVRYENEREGLKSNLSEEENEYWIAQDKKRLEWVERFLLELK